MIELETYRSEIKRFWGEAIKNFSVTYPDSQLTCVALYCCPCAGWLTINFDTEKDSDNCPDFIYSAFDLLQLEEWQEEYDNDSILEINVNDEIKSIDVEEEGDEAFNEVVFDYLKMLLQDPKLLLPIDDLNKGVPFRMGVQMLDSAYEEFWVVRE